MATSSTKVRPTPKTDSAEPEHRQSRNSPSLEDRVDYTMVLAARTLAAKRGEKAIAWSDLKKKLDL